MIVSDGRELELFLLLVAHPCQHTIEDVVVPLLLHLVNQARFLQQILLDLRPLDAAALVEVDVDVFAETGGVVVSEGLCVSKSCGGRQL